MGFKRELKALDAQIAAFEKIVADFPLADAYKTILASLRTKRAELVSTIGRD